MEENNIVKLRAILRSLNRELIYQNSTACCNGISLAQCHALFEVENKTDITITEVSDKLMLNKSTISRTIDGLVNIGLINRDIPKEDRRTAVLNLTDNGKEMCNNINLNNNNYVEKTISVLTHKEQNDFIFLLEKVTKRMEELRREYNKDDCC